MRETSDSPVAPLRSRWERQNCFDVGRTGDWFRIISLELGLYVNCCVAVIDSQKSLA